MKKLAIGAAVVLVAGFVGTYVIKQPEEAAGKVRAFFDWVLNAGMALVKFFETLAMG